MPAAIIVQLLVTFGPAAVELIQKLFELWSKPALSIAEFQAVMSLVPRKCLADYLAEAGASSRPTVPS